MSGNEIKSTVEKKNKEQLFRFNIRTRGGRGNWQAAVSKDTGGGGSTAGALLDHDTPEQWAFGVCHTWRKGIKQEGPVQPSTKGGWRVTWGTPVLCLPCPPSLLAGDRLLSETGLQSCLLW